MEVISNLQFYNSLDLLGTISSVDPMKTKIDINRWHDIYLRYLTDINLKFSSLVDNILQELREFL